MVPLVLDLIPYLEYHALQLLVAVLESADVDFRALKLPHGLKVFLSQLISQLFIVEVLHHFVFNLILDGHDATVKSGSIELQTVELPNLGDEGACIYYLVVRRYASQVILFGHLHCQWIIGHHYHFRENVMDQAGEPRISRLL